MTCILPLAARFIVTTRLELVLPSMFIPIVSGSRATLIPCPGRTTSIRLSNGRLPARKRMSLGPLSSIQAMMSATDAKYEQDLTLGGGRE